MGPAFPMDRPRFSPVAVSLPPSPSPSLSARALSGWRARLASDPIPRLLREGSPSILARIRRDLIDDSEAPTPKEIWAYPAVKAWAKKMDKHGNFAPKPAEKAVGSVRFAAVLANVRAIDRLADLGASEDGSAAAEPLRRTAGALLASQGADGGIADLALGETPTSRGKAVALHFQGWAVAAMARAGLDNDPRVQKAFRYLIERRQDDGGWAWRGVRTESAARPSSHLITGMVLRACASAPAWRTSRESRRAGELLATRFLQPDRYPDRKAPAYWELLSEPRFYTDVLDALDTVTAIGLGKENSGVRTAEAYIRSRQAKDGLWYPGPPGKINGVSSARPDKGARGGKDKDIEVAIWLTLRVLVVLRRIN